MSDFWWSHYFIFGHVKTSRPNVPRTLPLTVDDVSYETAVRTAGVYRCLDEDLTALDLQYNAGQHISDTDDAVLDVFRLADAHDERFYATTRWLKLETLFGEHLATVPAGR